MNVALTSWQEPLAAFNGGKDIVYFDNRSNRTMRCTCDKNNRRGLMCAHMKAIFLKASRANFTFSPEFRPGQFIKFPLFEEWMSYGLHVTPYFDSLVPDADCHEFVVRVVPHHDCVFPVLPNFEVGICNNLYFPGLRADLIEWTEATFDTFLDAGVPMECGALMHHVGDGRVTLQELDLKMKCRILWSWLEKAMCWQCYERTSKIEVPF